MYPVTFGNWAVGAALAIAFWSAAIGWLLKRSRRIRMRHEHELRALRRAAERHAGER